MRYFLFLFLLLLAPQSSKATPPEFIEEMWVGNTPTDRFMILTQLSMQSLLGYQERLVPYFMARGVTDDLTWESLVQKDLFHIAHAFSLLFEQNSTDVLHNLLGNHFSLMEGHSFQIDHVGRELFGPLSCYLPLLEAVASKLRLVHLRSFVFPSTQVVKALQKHDPSLKGVTIGRAYFQNLDTGRVGCLELFQASLQDEKAPQHFEATKERFSLLTRPQSGLEIAPIDHLSVELSTVEEVEHIHRRIHELASNTLIPNQKEVSYNPGDGSTQTKALMRDFEDTSFNKIIEFVHYAK